MHQLRSTLHPVLSLLSIGMCTSHCCSCFLRGRAQQPVSHNVCEAKEELRAIFIGARIVLAALSSVCRTTVCSAAGCVHHVLGVTIMLFSSGYHRRVACSEDRYSASCCVSYWEGVSPINDSIMAQRIGLRSLCRRELISEMEATVATGRIRICSGWWCRVGAVMLHSLCQLCSSNVLPLFSTCQHI